MMQATVRQAVQAGATNSNGHAHAARDPTSPPYGHIGRRFHRPASRQCRPRESSKAGSNKPRHAREVTTMTDTQPAAPQAPAPSDEQARETAKVAPPTGADWRHAFRDRVKDQLGVRGMVSEYLIPVETNTFWYFPRRGARDLAGPGDPDRIRALAALRPGRRPRLRHHQDAAE